MYVWMHVCTYGCMYVRMDACMHPRDERLCQCGLHVQTLDHVINDCTLMNSHRTVPYLSLSEFFNNHSAVIYLRNIATTLKI